MADQVLAVALVPLLVVVLTGIGVVLAALYDCLGDEDQGVGDRDTARRSSETIDADAQCCCRLIPGIRLLKGSKPDK